MRKKRMGVRKKWDLDRQTDSQGSLVEVVILMSTRKPGTVIYLFIYSLTSDFCWPIKFLTNIGNLEGKRKKKIF